MDNTTSFNICVDSDILKQCEAMYGELGVDLNTAINVFLNKSLCVGGFPLDVNKETMAAMLEPEHHTESSLFLARFQADVSNHLPFGFGRVHRFWYFYHQSYFTQYIIKAKAIFLY